jgi:hypothetical protein
MAKRWVALVILDYLYAEKKVEPMIKVMPDGWGFKRIELAAGKSGQAVINLPSASFEFFDQTTGKMAVNPGEYEIWFGNSSDARDLKMAMITIQ